MSGISGADATERLAAVRDAAEEVARRYDRAYFLKCIDDDREPIELMRALGESGLLGIGLSPEMGGEGGGLTDEVALIETLCRSGVPPHSLLITNFCRHLLAEHGSPEQRAEFLPGTLTAETKFCFAITEADAGTNTLAIRTRADRNDSGDDADWVINGEKVYISGSDTATHMCLVARTSPNDTEKRTHGLSIFVFPLPCPGISMIRMRITATLPEHQHIVSFDDVHIPATAVIGEPGSAMRIMFSALNPERVLGGALAIGLGRHVLAKATQFARTRAPFDRPIGGYQAVQHLLARAFVNLEAATLMVYDAAARIDRGESGGVQANAANLFSSEAAFGALDAAIEVHGGAAMDHDSDLLAFTEFLRHLRLAPINNQMILNYIAERALDLPRSY